MRALVFTGPGKAEVLEVPAPVAGPGQVVVDVERAGVCGTDHELFTGAMSYLHTGASSYPLRPGHEWCGVVSAAGEGVDAGWVGRRVTGDTMIGCGRCRRCRQGRHHVCEQRYELGIRDGLAGALAEQVAVPARYLHGLPDAVDPVRGALVEPGGNAVRCVDGVALSPGERLLVLGTGTIGLLVALFARARGIEVHLLGVSDSQLGLARSLGFGNAWTSATLPRDLFDGVVDASTAPSLPALALERVEPGRHIVYIGLSATESVIDSRDLVFKDVTAIGILGASAGLSGAIAAYADGSVDPRPLVGATIGLEDVAEVLASGPPPGAGPGPKIHVTP
jgi:threonine dehydrogenase-like Zn-dependent dehydrogenase